MTTHQSSNNAESKTENGKAGKLAGTGAGVFAGAQLGTVLLPIPIVGTFTGALVGGLVGNKIGKRFGGAILDKLDTSASACSAEAGSPSNLASELERLTDLRAAGVLTDEEFAAAKAKLLGL